MENSARLQELPMNQQCACLRQLRWLMRGRRGIRCDRARAVIASKLLHPEDSGAGAALGLLDLRSVKLHLVANLDGGGVAFERIGLSVSGLQVESVGVGHHAPGYDVMAPADFDGQDDRDSDRLRRCQPRRLPTSPADGPMLPGIWVRAGNEAPSREAMQGHCEKCCDSQSVASVPVRFD